MVRAALGALSLAALLAFAPPAGAAQEPLRLEDLPTLQHDLRGATQGRDKEQFTTFVQEVYYEAGKRRLKLVGVDWQKLLTGLRELAGERKLPEANLNYLDLQLAYFVSEILLDRASGQQILERALARTDDRSPYRFDLALLAENIEREQEHWEQARLHLGEAERAIAREPADSPDRARFRSRSAKFWLALGMPELARPHVEFELARLRNSQDSGARLDALVDELSLLTVEENYSAVDARWEEVRCEPWLVDLGSTAQGLCQLLVAACSLSREHDELAPRGAAAWMLDELRGADRIDGALRRWVVRHAANCAADAGEWERARALCDELACEIGVLGAPPDYLPTGRLGAALIALEARIERAQSRGAADRVQRLRPHLERLRRSWSEFLENWSGAPARGGGLAYLGIAERHQILQELIELALEVEGAEAGARSALQSVLEGEQQSTLSRRMQLPRASVDEALAELTGPQAGLLVYVCSRDRSFVFALDPRGVRLFHLDAGHRLKAPCQDLAAAAALAVREGRGLDDPELRATAAACARVLLPAELEQHIEGWRELSMIGIDDVGYVPFELLPARAGGTQGERRAIRYAHSIPLALYLERLERPTLEGRARLLLATGLGGAEEQLALRRAERDALVEALPGEPELLEGAEASAARLGVGPGEDIGLLYVLGHGKQEVTRDRPGGLVLAGAAGAAVLAWAEEIETLRSAPLVVLTACKAGRAPLHRGDGGRSDLAAAFLYAGAATVVLPTCDLQVDATLRLVPRVFRSLAAGESAAEALREARAGLAARGDSVGALAAHLLHVVGRGGTALRPRQAEPAADSARWVAGSLLLAALAVALGFARARRRAAR